MSLSPTAGIGGAGIGGAGIGGAGISKDASAPAYTGPLDLVPGADWVYAHSVTRALSSSMLGQPLFTLVRASDSAELSFSADEITGLVSSAEVDTWLGSNQSLLVATVAAGGSGYAPDTSFNVTLVGGTGTAAVVRVTAGGDGVVFQVDSIITYGAYSAPPANPVATTGGTGTGLTLTCSFAVIGLFKELFDHTGNGIDLDQITAGAQARWTATGFNGLPGFRDIGGSGFIKAASGGFSAPEITVFIAAVGEAKLTSDGADAVEVQVGATAYNFLFIESTEAVAGSEYGAQLSDGVPYIVGTAWESGNNVFKANGSALTETGSLDDGVPAGALVSPPRWNAGSGVIAECLAANGILSGGDQTLITNDQLAFYELP